MKLLLAALIMPALAAANGSLSGYCTQGGQKIITNGIPSTTQVMQSYPQCSVTVYYTGGPSGLVSTSGSTVTLAGGTSFNASGQWSALSIVINSVTYAISSVSSPTSLTLTTSAGTQSTVAYSMAATTPAPIFTSNGSALANPFTASLQGYWQFYAGDGQYDVKQSGGGIPAPVTWGNQTVFDSLYTAPGGIPLPYPTYVGSIVNVLSYGAVATGNGATGADSSAAFQNAINALNSRGGGALFIPWKPLCYWAQNLTIYSNITYYSDSRSTCVQKPAGSLAAQMFTTANVGVPNAQGTSNIHFYNFTIDGNRANQTGLPANQNGMFGIITGGCSGCSVERMTVENQYTDGVDIDGAGTQTLAGTANTSVNTVSISGVTWAGGVAVYTTSGNHNLVNGTPIIISGITPSGYNFPGSASCGAFVMSATTFNCPVSLNPGAYVSGGAVTSYEVSNIAGTGLQNMTDGAQLTISGVVYGVALYVSPTQVMLGTAVSPGSQTGAVISIPAYVTAGNNFTVRDSLITNSGRNNISIGAETNVHLLNNELSLAGFSGCGAIVTAGSFIVGASYTIVSLGTTDFTAIGASSNTVGVTFTATGAGSGTGTAQRAQLNPPNAGYDREPYMYGGYFDGFESVGNDTHGNCGNGESLFAEITYDPTDSPFVADNVHDNVGLGVFSPDFGASAGTIKVTGTIANNAGCCGIGLSGWQAPRIEAIVYGSERALDLAAGVAGDCHFTSGAAGSRLSNANRAIVIKVVPRKYLALTRSDSLSRSTHCSRHSSSTT